MSMDAPTSPARRSAAYRRLCAQAFAEHIRAARLRGGRALAELAPGAGITVSEWEQIEAGRIPDAWEQVLRLVAALGIDRSWLPYFARLCEGAQEQSTAAGPESFADSGERYS